MEESSLILVVDDEADFREILSTKLASAGFRVETAENGQAAVEKAKRLRPQLILMDVRMPVMDGAQAMLELQKYPETKGIKVAFLTSLGDPRSDMQDVDRSFSDNFGAAQYLKKTEDLDALAEKIKALLN